jgi:DUF4097 and DUF4098 domain-containing protein YvlB
MGQICACFSWFRVNPNPNPLHASSLDIKQSSGSTTTKDVVSNFISVKSYSGDLKMEVHSNKINMETSSGRITGAFYSYDMFNAFLIQEMS